MYCRKSILAALPTAMSHSEDRNSRLTPVLMLVFTLIEGGNKLTLFSWSYLWSSELFCVTQSTHIPRTWEELRW